MSVTAISSRVVGGVATVQAALANPQVRETAELQGVDLSDPAQVQALLATVNLLMPPPQAAFTVSTGQANSRPTGSAARVYGALAYQAVAALR